MRTALAVQAITRAGLEAAYTAANVDGHSLPNTAHECVHVVAGATPVNVTLVTPGSVDGQAVADRVVTVPANEDRFIGPFPRSIYNQPGTNEVYLNFDSVATITIAALRL